MFARTCVVVVVGLAAAAMGACRERGAGGAARASAGAADLVPSSGSGDACQVQGEAVLITVKNQGAVDAPVTFTRVEFAPTTAVAWTVPTPKIKKGESVQLSPVSMPSDCHGATCSVKIISDFTHATSKAGGKTISCHGS